MAKKKRKTKELKTYTISDGQMVLTLEEAEEGGFIVRSPSDPELITQAETIEEAFYMARDAAQALHECRVDLMREIRELRTAG